MPVPFDKLDLNLLRVFDTLMEERGVSRAARRLGITQSSTSNALERLRGALDDRVLERAGNAMVPTRAALDLWPHVQAALARLAEGLNGLETFDPASLRQTYAIGMDEYSLTLLGPAIEARLVAAAPHLRVAFRPATPQENEQDLLAGDLDLIVGPAWRPIPGLARAVLLHETFVALVDAGHPLLAGHGDRTVRAEDYARYPHILVSRRGFVPGNVDAGLHRLGLRREIVLTTPYFASAPGFVRGTDRILNLGRGLADRLGDAGLAAFELPLAVPGFDICVVWHPRNGPARAHRWLRDEIQAAAAARDGAG